MTLQLRPLIAATLVCAPVIVMAQNVPQPAPQSATGAPEQHYTLRQLESAGYVPSDAEQYPQNLHAAERRLDARYARDALGGATPGTSEQGYRSDGTSDQPADQNDIYKGP